MSQTYKSAVQEPIPVGNTVSKIILVSINYIVYRGKMAVNPNPNPEHFKIPIACFHFAGISPNQNN